ncbi:hypothetical protein Poli38472_001528 [Pythium oligandrum]|uniref:ATPase AAA-type core domain-containing protein n=1 Tax=Pythium oligandrum TaxID=41045 RepID=A0A8K1CUZ9_PYTOL|nr:hypothetical protein Poli38472_001528 [Pythium oligandrum]|eukprot:TMW69372.1 hypothetical protein Poli38472_001528 [Pythium oligandrum]
MAGSTRRSRRSASDASASGSKGLAGAKAMDMDVEPLIPTENALSLVAGDAGATMDEVEAIDTEEDDSEFDEKAHWARKSAKTKKTPSKRKAAAEDKSQPKINLFYVVQRPMETEVTDTASVVSESTLEISMTSVHALGSENGSEQASSEQETSTDVVMEEEETQTPATLPSAETPRSKRERETIVIDDSPVQPSPMSASGRPKRQAVLDAERRRQSMEGDEEVTIFTTPPMFKPSTKQSKDRATLEGEPERKVNASGRKRKLELNGKKKPSQSSGASTPNGGARPDVFFLSKADKKQVMEIEAVASFKEQLRQQRERDLAFFSQRGGEATTTNPFFQARKAEKKVIDVDAEPTVIDLDDESSSGQTKSRWSKEAVLFSKLQHTVCVTEAPGDIELQLPPRRTLDEENVSMERTDLVSWQTDCVSYRPDHADAQAIASEFFWLMASSHGGAEAIEQHSILTENQSEDEWIERLSETFGVKEKRIRKTLTALEDARSKRFDKFENLAWVDRYLPTQPNGMIGNKRPLRLLSTWLSAWKNGGDDHSRRSCFQAELYVFEQDEDSDEDDGSELCRLFILEGDVGSGKSAGVYACAEELGFEVIEINAAQPRTGKHIVEIAGEATQSTRVLHMGSGPNDKKQKKKKRSTKKRRSDEGTRPSHLSLVLFEDIDLVFEDDKGFLNTLCSIAKHSKCPIVATCSKRPDGFPSSPQTLNERMEKPQANEFMLWLTLVAYLEGMVLPKPLAARLAELFHCDIRRSLHFLQTHRHQIGGRRQETLVWNPSAATPASGEQVIEIPDSQDDVIRSVPAWTRWDERSYDLFTSNFVSQLSGSLQNTADDKTREEKVRDAKRWEEIAAVMDASSIADVWGSLSVHQHDDAFFHAQGVESLVTDVRMLSLSQFAHQDADTETAYVAARSTIDCVSQVLDDVLSEKERYIRPSKLSTIKDKLDLPLFTKGSQIAATNPRFALDVVPMLAHILESNAPQQESRRRTSRRNHYLRDVLTDMSITDDILAFHTYRRHRATAEDEIVPSSPAASPSRS